MAFNWNFKPRTRKGFYSAPVESLMPQAPGAIPTQMKGQVNLPEIEQPFDFNSYFTNLVNREEMDGYHPAQNFSVPNQQHGGNPAVNYDGYSPTTPMSEQDVINQNLAERQTGNADDMANWIQQGGTPQADAAAAAQAQAEQEAAAKTQRIAEIESEIKEIETRIATNTAKLQNFTGNADKIAAIEARKINAQDPTSIWRWKEGVNQQRINRQQDLERIEKEKAKAKDEQKQFIRNKISSTLPTMSIGWNTSPAQIQQFKNTLAGLKTEAMNSKLSDQYNALLEAEAQLNDKLPQQKAQIAMNDMANAADLFNVTKAEGGFGKDSKAYHDYLLQQYTKITKEFPEAKYDPEFNKAFSDADKLFRKTVKTKKVRPSGRS